MIHKSIYLLVCTLSVSCTPQKNQAFIGTWQLDSLSLPEGGKMKYTQTLKITLLEDYTFRETWWDYDVGYKQAGKYFVNHNPNRPTLPLTLIPDLILAEKDTIWGGIKSMDLLKVTETKLITIENVNLYPKDGKPGGRYNQLKYYKRIKGE